MYNAYAIINVLPYFISTLAVICVACYYGGRIRATYLWNKADEAHDAVDASKYYVAMLFDAADKAAAEQKKEDTVPSLEELADMASDLAETAEEEFDAWVDAIDNDEEYQRFEEERQTKLYRRRRNTILGVAPHRVTFTDIQWAV